MSNLSLVTTPSRPDTDTELVLESINYPLIEPGKYEAYMVSYETSMRFAKSSLKTIVTWRRKVFVKYGSDPLNKAGLGNEKIIVFLSFNVKTIMSPCSKNGQFTAARRSNDGKLTRRLFEAEESAGATPNALKINSSFYMLERLRKTRSKEVFG
tara:strand:+ start:98 stop:559 length:462 start_codon:yes stop_codon:yes gene_type:complete